MTNKILLVLPEWRMISRRWKLNDHPYIQKKALFPPIALATVAALTPESFDPAIWDESVHGALDEAAILAGDYRLVAVGGFVTHYDRSCEIGALCRQAGVPVVVGGAGVSAAPQRYRDHFDVLILGEAERVWPEFLQDFAAGRHRREYRDDVTVDMALSPAPRWGQLAPLMAKSYAVGAVQTSRGCPFICEFCTVWKVHGRTMRTKPIPQVMEEIKLLHRLGMEAISFCNDNFYGDRVYCKKVLRELVALNATLDRPLRFYAEVSINIANDEEILELLSTARFAGLFIGVESPNPKSLKEAAKVQNMKGSLSETCRKIQSYGLPIEASMIVGFDCDDTTIFDEQFHFLQDTGIAYPRICMLQARPNTGIRAKMIQEGRVLDITKLHGPGEYFDTFLIPDIIPGGMTRAELLSHSLGLVERLLDWDNFTARLKRYINNISYPPALARPESEGGEAPDQLKAFITSLEPDVRGKVLEILNLCAERAPAQMYNVVTQIVRHSIEAGTLAHTRGTILRQLEFEQGIDLRTAVIPAEAALAMA